MKLQKMFLLFVIVLSTLTVFQACKKEDSGVNVPITQTPTTATQPTPDYSSVANFNGTLATIDFGYNIMGFVIEYSMGFGKLGHPTGVDGGVVTVNGDTIGSYTQSGQVYYNSFNTTNPSALSHVSFDGSAHAWNVAGGNGIPAFSASVTSPTVFAITLPADTARINKSGGLQVTWTGAAAGPDSLLIMLAATSGGSIVRQGLSNSGSYNFSASDLASLSGTTIVSVVKYRYAITNQGGKNYVLVSEVVKTKNITLQ
ncbi:MAG: hypothetical protein HY964_07570 [Ignavibacteriales bacterium]|nr:hypothetical protein [Ignavibacteriales bacterium]